MRDQLETARHYVTREEVRVHLRGPTPNGRWAVFFAECDGQPGLLHHENPTEYGADPVWTFVPDGLPASSYAIDASKHILLQANRIPRSLVRQSARDSLARSARCLRGLRGTDAEKELEWEPCGEGELGTLKAKVGSGWIYLWPPRRYEGVEYTSSFGPNSERSFSGYLPGLTLEEAKKLVYHSASKYW